MEIEIAPIMFAYATFFLWWKLPAYFVWFVC